MGTGSHIKISESGIKEITSGTLNAFFKVSIPGNLNNKNYVESFIVQFSHWRYADLPTGIKNPEYTTTVNIDPMETTGWQFSAQFDLPTDITCVYAYARIKWKSRDVKTGNETKQIPWYGNDEGYEDFSSPLIWRLDEGSWPKVPPTPELTVRNGKIIATISDIEPASPSGLGYVNDIRFELWSRKEKLVKTIDDRVWDGTLTENNENQPEAPSRTTARAEFPISYGDEYYVRATSIRYGNGRAPLNGAQYFPLTTQGHSGWTEWVPDGEIGLRSNPTPPYDLKVKALSATSVRLSWEFRDNTSDAAKIIYATRKEYLEEESNQTTEISDIKGLSYVVGGLESGNTYFFQVVATNDSEFGGESNPSNTVSVTLGRRPAAPTTWSSTTTAKKGQLVYLYWTHNSEDNSIQMFADLEVLVNGKKINIPPYETPDDLTDDEDKKPTSSHPLDTSLMTSDKNVIEWKVRTAGVLKEPDGSPAYGPWSVVRTVEIFSPPSVTMAGDRIVKSFPYYITLTGLPLGQKVMSFNLSILSRSKYIDFDPTGSEVYIGLDQEIFSFDYDPPSNKNVSEELFSWNYKTHELKIKLNPQNINLSAGQKYRAMATVSVETGLSESNFYDFTVDWSEKMDGFIIGNVDIKKEDLTANIYTGCVNGTNEPIRNVTLAVYRRTFDGNYIPLATDISNEVRNVVVDPHPPLDYANYRVVAMDNRTGAVIYEDLYPAEVHEICAVIQWDEAWPSYYPEYNGPGNVVQPQWQGTMLKLPWNFDISDKWSPQVSKVEYIGREHPVSYYGTQVGSTSSWKLDVVKADRETIAKLRRLATYKGDVYVREPYGSGYWANVKVSFSQNHTDLVVPVTIDVTRVEGGV